MPGTLIRQAIYAALTLIGFVWTNYYLVQFTVATKGEFTATNLLNFDLSAFIEQVWANPASSFVAVDLTIALLLVITFIVSEGRRLKLRLWGIYIALMFAISFAFGFALFMFVRERKLAETAVLDPTA
jgi:Terpene cyclase DEP1